MVIEEFDKYIQEMQNFYGQQLRDKEIEVWFNNLQFMTIHRFNLILSEIYKSSVYMPKLADILKMHKSIPYTATNEREEIKGKCNKCNETGYVIYTRVIEGTPYKYTAVCDCGRQQRYDGTKCTDPRNQSQYYIPTAKEIGLEVKSALPSKEDIIKSMNKLKDSKMVSEQIKDIIRKQFVKM